MIQVEIQIDGQWLPRNNSAGFTVELQDGGRIQAVVTNNSGKPVRFGGFRFTGFEFPAKGKDIRIFREGWTMPAPVGSRRFGEADYHVSDGYKRFCVSDAPAYDGVTPNRFSGEYVAMLNDKATGNNMLAGFISSADQFTRMAVELDDAGVKEFSAYCYGDNILFEPGESIRSEILVIRHGANAWKLLEEYASDWAKQMNARSWDHVPTDWCSWYYYFHKVTEADILENLNYCIEHKKDFPMEYFQIDDGYQPYLGDWLEPSKNFPHGIQPVLEKIAATGIKPGLWFAPFAVEKGSRILEEHPEWMIHDANGEILYPATWRDNVPIAILDATHPEVYNHLRDLFRAVRKSGCVYVKLDFMMYEVSVTGGVYHNPKMTRAQAIRRGYEAIREGIGEDAFMLGCTSPLGSCAGIVNANRIGTDITPYWGREEDRANVEAPWVRNVCRNIINRRYMHKRLWINDPDVHIARKDNNELTENEIQLWTSALWLVGGLVLISDRFSTLAPERAELSKLLLAQTDTFDAYPVDLFDREIPAIWAAKRNSDGAPCVGVFNFEDDAQTLDVDLVSIFGKGVTLKDHWTGRTILSDSGKVELPKHTCVILMKA